MKIPLSILAFVALSLAALYWLAPGPTPEELQARTDLPWQVEANADGSSRVFDLVLGEATLGDAMRKFGALQGLALFEPQDGPLALEAYFGDVRFGPLKAKVVVGLAATDEELEALRARSARREGSPSGDWKHPLEDAPEQHAQRRLQVITYIPGTRGLDQAFFRQRFGEPAAWLQESEHAVSWFYPRLGLTVLIDERASEVFEYQAPRDFELPPGVTPNPAYR